MRVAACEAKSFKLVMVMSLLLLAPSVWASSGAKEKGDWHVHNQSDYQVIVSIKTATGTNCLNSYIDPQQTLGLPAELHHCPYPLIATIKTMQAGQAATCEATLEQMRDITFTGEKCE